MQLVNYILDTFILYIFVKVFSSISLDNIGYVARISSHITSQLIERNTLFEVKMFLIQLVQLLAESLFGILGDIYIFCLGSDRLLGFVVKFR